MINNDEFITPADATLRPHDTWERELPDWGEQGVEWSHMKDRSCDDETPIYDFIGDRDISDVGDLSFVLEDLVHSIEDGYFLEWEAVVRDEEGLPLSKEQQQALDQLFAFDDEDDDIASEG